MAHLDRKNEVICTQDNQIIESCYSMTLLEKRLLLLTISKIDSTQFPKSTIPLIISVDAAEWAKYYSESNPWRDVKLAAKSLLSKHVTFHPKVGVEKKVNWFSSIEYHDEDGWITIEFTRPMQVRLAGMLEQFTKIDLLSVSKFKSIYSIRLYEIISQFGGTGYRVISLEDFRFSMDCQDRYRENKELIKFVVKPALKEINQKTNLKIQMENVKKGRKISAFKFIFYEDKQADLF